MTRMIGYYNRSVVFSIGLRMSRKFTRLLDLQIFNVARRSMCRRDANVTSATWNMEQKWDIMMQRDTLELAANSACN